MERIEYFAQQIRRDKVKKETAEADVRQRILMVKDPDVWRFTYEQIAAKAWRTFDVANIGV